MGSWVVLTNIKKPVKTIICLTKAEANLRKADTKKSTFWIYFCQCDLETESGRGRKDIRGKRGEAREKGEKD